MTHSSKLSELTLKLPITTGIRQLARNFADEQPSPDKAIQVYFNTIAVLVVKNYLDILGIVTNLPGSYSWNPIGRLCANLADLNLPGKGHLECRPIQRGEQVWVAPPEVWHDRIGYLVVSIDEEHREAQLLGFLPLTQQVRNSIRDLQPLEQLLVRLHHPIAPLIHLSQWFEHLFDAGWQALDSFVNHQNPTFAFRSSQVRGIPFQIRTEAEVRRSIEQLYHEQNQLQANAGLASLNWTGLTLVSALAQLIQVSQNEELRWTAAEILWTLEPEHPAAGVRRMIDLGLQLGGHSLGLMIALLQIQEKFAILARVYPLGNQLALPPNLGLNLLDEAGSSLLEVRSRQRDDYIQIKCQANSDERFSIQLSLDQATITEHFLV